MILDDLETALAAVEATYDEAARGLLPLARSAIDKPALVLSRLLLGTMAMGGDPSGRSEPKSAAQVCSCRALEFLDQALELGASVASDQGYDEDKLLVTDYLYGQAIDQVIKADEPDVIAVLATAIAEAAQDKLDPRGPDYRFRLISATLNISLILGDFDEETFALLADVRRLAAAGSDEWRSALPAGEIADFIHAPKAAAKKD